MMNLATKLAILKESKLVEELGLGEDCVLKSVTIHEDKIVFEVNVGPIVYEESTTED